MMQQRHTSRVVTRIARVAGALAVVAAALAGEARSQGLSQLNENCIVSVLNRNTRVRPDGSWVLPNIPANFGLVRARATCIIDGLTLSGESAPFLVLANASVDVPRIVLGATTPIPVALALASSKPQLTSVGDTAQLTVTASYADGSTLDVTGGGTGTQYVVSNPALGGLTADGVVTGLASGTVLIQATHEGTAGFIAVPVVLAGADTDKDGIPDALELELGLDPNNAADALEDLDRDGLSNGREVQLGTGIRNPDTDGDGLADGDEVTRGTSALLWDTDGDGVSDGLEVANGTDPLNPLSVDLGKALKALVVAPATFTIVVNDVQGVAFQQLTVTGQTVDGRTIDLTSTQRGTNYASSDLDVCNFGQPDGRVFGGQGGGCTITVTNSGHTAQTVGTVITFTPAAISFVTIPGFANNVDVSGSFAYVAAGAAGLHIVSVSNKQAPAIVATIDTPGNANDVKVVGTLAYVADGISGLQIIDVSNPAAPVRVGGFDTPGDAWDVVVSDNRAYVADGVSGLRIIDVTHAAAPSLLGSIDPPGTQKGVDVDPARRLAVVASGTSGLHIIDVADPAAPVLRGTLAGGDVRDVVVQNTFAFLADYERSLTPVDISNAALPVAGAAPSLPLGGRLHDVAVQGSFALGADVLFVNGVPVINLDAPLTPVVRARIDFPGDFDGQGIAADAGFVYMAGVAGSAFSENGATGSSRLFIGQYMALEDRSGVAPTVAITAPQAGTEVIEGASLSVRASATDDVAVASVTFLVNGAPVFTDSSEPYQISITAPAPGPLVLGARAVDLGNNIATAQPVTVTVVPDPLTTVVGRVVDSEGAAVADATVKVFTRETQSAADGTFSIAGVPTILGPVRASASITIDGRRLGGASTSIPPVVGGITDVGLVRVVSFGGLFGAAFSGPTGPASLYQIDPETGAATLIGPIGFWRVSSLDAAADGTLYGVGRNPADGRNVLLSIDPLTGAGTQIGPTGVESLGYGQTISDISFRPSDGVLFAYLEAGDGLGTINLTTGAATALGSSLVFGCCGNGMAFAPDGRLLHANENRLHVLDQVTGAAQVLATLSYPPFGFSRMSSMDFHPESGELIGFMKSDSGTFLVRIDIVTGGVTVIGSQTVNALDAITWGPER